MRSTSARLTLIGLILIAGCSSKPEKSYQINNFRQASIDYAQLADRKRQQEEYSDALDLYLKAETYALKRNDQRHIGVSKLKRAIIHIAQENYQAARALVAEVEKADQIETLNLAQAISFVRAKLLLARGETSRAFKLLSDLENYYREDIERLAYYQLMRWSHDYQQLDPSSVSQIIDNLTSRFDSKTLNNVEIISFAYLEHARWAARYSSLEQGQPIIERSIEHFSFLELTPKIARSLMFAADFYGRHGLTARAEYFITSRQRLISGN